VADDPPSITVEGIEQPGTPEDVFARLAAMTRDMRALGLTVTLDIHITIGMPSDDR